jgi:phenol hydroxylase P3 protein
MHSPNHWFDRVWYLSVPKSFFEDACTAGPFEFLTAVSFSFEYVLTNLLFVPFMSGAAHNGDMSTVTFGFSAQSDESRHMTLGIECIKFMLEQDPDNVPIVQRWIDKWFWRGYRVLTLVAMMQDYMLPKRVMSWKEAWEMYAERTAARCSRTWRATASASPRAGRTPARARTTSATRPGTPSTTTPPPRPSTPGCPGRRDAVAVGEVPQHLRQALPPAPGVLPRPAAAGQRFYNKTLPMLCQTCQIPMLFTEPGDATQIAYRESSYLGDKFHFCSDHCKEIFDHEPEKYVQAWLPVHQIYQGNCFKPGVDPTAPGFDPLAAVLDYYELNVGRDNFDFEGSEDQKNFAAWRGDGTNTASGEQA